MNFALLLLPRGDVRVADRAVADVHGREERGVRDDGQREVPAADGLVAQPHPEEAGQDDVHERDDAADAGDALDASEDRLGRSRWPSLGTGIMPEVEGGVDEPARPQRHDPAAHVLEVLHQRLAEQYHPGAGGKPPAQLRATLLRRGAGPRAPSAGEALDKASPQRNVQNPVTCHGVGNPMPRTPLQATTEFRLAPVPVAKPTLRVWVSVGDERKT